MKARILKRFYHVYINNTSIEQIFTPELECKHLLIKIYRGGTTIEINDKDNVNIHLFNKFKEKGLYIIK